MVMDVLAQGLLVDNIHGSIEPTDVAIEPINTKRMSSNATSMIAVAYTSHVRKSRKMEKGRKWLSDELTENAACIISYWPDAA